MYIDLHVKPFTKPYGIVLENCKHRNRRYSSMNEFKEQTMNPIRDVV